MIGFAGSLLNVAGAFSEAGGGYITYTGVASSRCTYVRGLVCATVRYS